MGAWKTRGAQSRFVFLRGGGGGGGVIKPKFRVNFRVVASLSLLSKKRKDGDWVMAYYIYIYKSPRE